ncbi:MAG TPA: hypothetical protein VMI12_06115, partial [Puia sp.]|nr:hypothetical protein [Puia sp.]
MKKIFLFLFCYPLLTTYAQDNYEIQVYGSQTQQPKSMMFELHSNYTFDGQMQTVKGVVPTYHA